MYPDDLKYTREHEWARAEGDRATVGITHYAQEALGDIVYVDLPPVGTAVTGGEAFGEVESTKSVSDIYSPVTGTVAERNDELDKSPELINSDPYGQGWLVVVEMGDADELDQLMDAEAYSEMVAEA
ncbi:MAG TPA: glycine cleavage system protein GcvH [Actinomycetota bacterium]|jgi:glycine cleavage system H protein|nr:glycine cleavage system protein GcvH [Actinomycetota bacterium]